ncbi:MAG: metallophosphoesterase [Polyangia bacterium]
MPDESLQILHLSDLHIDAEDGRSDGIERALFAALRAGQPWSLDLVVVTGDVLDTASIGVESALRAVRAWRAQLHAALGKRVPLILLPGNHDRRTIGIFSPQRDKLFRALKAGLSEPDVWVAGCALPQLAEVMPPELTRALPFDVCTYDTTFLGTGKLSAGGTLRADDMLQLASWLEPVAEGSPPRPLVLLMHHHLVPTPVTDTVAAGGGAELAALPRFLLHKVAPWLIAHGDREELFMTALGSGSALSLLHALRRPVVVLHGHKHCPAARLVRSPEVGSGDVLLVSAGSAGLAERWSTEGADEDRPMTMWPSYNLVTYSDRAFHVQTVAFKPEIKVTQTGLKTELVSRPLVTATQDGALWGLTPQPERGPDLDGKLWQLTQAHYRLKESPSAPERWDLECEQEVRAAPDRQAPDEYGEPIFLLRDAVLENPEDFPKLMLPMPGRVRYRIARALCRSANEAHRVIGPDEAFANIELVCRHTSRVAELTLAAPDGFELEPFGSAMDLTTGQLRPVPLERTGSSWTLRYLDCPARTLLRIHWPLPERELEPVAPVALMD